MSFATTLPDAVQVTNLYLYGSINTPIDKTSPTLARPIDSGLLVDVDVNLYMAGPGRFATANKFELVSHFLNPWLHPESYSIPPGEYTKEQMRSLLGIEYAAVEITQALFDDGLDSYVDRVYVWNTTAFKIDDNARFVVEQNGNRYIDGFAIVPHLDQGRRENFDFEGGWTSEVANYFLENKIDPSGIGRAVEFEFVGDVPKTRFTYNDYVQASNGTQTGNPLNVIKLAASAPALLNLLFNSGATDFRDSEGRFVGYGTTDDDVLTALQFDSVFIDSLLRRALNSRGVRFISAEGSDSLTGGNRNDVLDAGAGADTLDGAGGSDLLLGGGAATISCGVPPATTRWKAARMAIKSMVA